MFLQITADVDGNANSDALLNLSHKMKHGLMYILQSWNGETKILRL